MPRIGVFGDIGASEYCMPGGKVRGLGGAACLRASCLFVGLGPVLLGAVQ